MVTKTKKHKNCDRIFEYQGYYASSQGAGMAPEYLKELAEYYKKELMDRVTATEWEGIRIRFETRVK